MNVTLQQLPLTTRMFEEEAETLTYEPISFVAQRPNTNPDSPRHFVNSKRQSNVNRKKPRRRSVPDLPANKENIDKVRKEVRDWNRSKSLMERWRVVLNGSTNLPSPGVARSQTVESLGLGERSLSYSKPITSRLKVREKRKLTLSDSSKSDSLLTRSKSDAGVYCPPVDLTREMIQNRCRALLKARLSSCEYTSSCESMDSCLDSSTSSVFDSFDKKNKRCSWSVSSGFGDYTGTESEYDTSCSSRSSSIFVPAKNGKTARPKSMEISLHQDKDILMYSKSLGKSRRPSSIVRSQSFGRRSESSDEGKENTAVVADDVFVTDDDSEIDGKCRERNGIENRRTFSPKVANLLREKKVKCKQARQIRPKGDGDITDVTNMCDVTNEACDHIPVSSVSSTDSVLSSENEAKDDGKISLEEYVHKLTLAASLNNKSLEQEGRVKKKGRKLRKKCVPSEYDNKRRGTIGFPDSVERGRKGSVRNIRIESCL